MKENPHIVFLKQTFQLKGGLEKYCLLLADVFSKEEFHVSLFTSSAPLEEKKDWHWVQIPIRVSKISFLKMVFFDFAVTKKLRNNEYNNAIIFGFDRHFVRTDIYRAGNGCHKAYLQRRWKEASFFKKCSLFFNPLHWCTLLSEKKTYESISTEVICNSHLVRSEILHSYPKADPARLHVIHNGVDWVQLEPLFQAALHDKQCLKERYNVPKDAVHIVLVGNEWYRKGVDICLKALSILQESLQRHHIAIFTTIAGKERSPKKFIELAESMGLRNQVQFLPGHISTLNLFQTADICVIPSRYDPFANITVEALAMGLWVATSRENGGFEVIQPGKNGFVSEICSEEGIAEGILSGIQKLMLLEVTKQSIRMSARHLDFHHSLQQYIDLVRQVAIKKNKIS